MSVLRSAAVLLLACLAGSATAQAVDPVSGGQPLSFQDLATRGASGRTRQVSFSALLGVQSTPGYFGSDEQEAGVKFSPGQVYLNAGWLTLGEGGFTDDPKAFKPGFGLRGSFRFIGERSSDDYSELKGLDDIDPTLELGMGVGYAAGSLEVFADARYGIGGSDAWVGEIGGNLVMRPTDRLVLRGGPRFLYGSEGFTDTYFGVTPAESARSGLAAYNVDESGLVSAGVELSATYRMGERWWLEGGARYDRLQGDAADSPIVKQGSADQTGVYVGLRRAFVLEF